ncbi:MAG: hypothetical protein KDE53_12795 [Caldilineaceae bacterium]|nr:hypothetical protein [Caldilineaceae bacterium]MCB0124126.1 hypothetical protein [Caldilineaceae bacterium]
MTYKTNQTWQDWMFFSITFIAVISVIHEPTPRLFTFGAALTLRPLYLLIWQRTLDVWGLIGVAGVATMAVLMMLHPGLPFFLFAAICFCGFVIAPIYISLRHTKQQQHASEQTAP